MAESGVGCQVSVESDTRHLTPDTCFGMDSDVCQQAANSIAAPNHGLFSPLRAGRARVAQHRGRVRCPHRDRQPVGKRVAALARARHAIGSCWPTCATRTPTCSRCWRKFARKAAPSYCAIVSPTGEYLAHSRAVCIGKPVDRARRHDRSLGRGRASRIRRRQRRCRFTSTARRSRPANSCSAHCDWALPSPACGATCVPAVEYAPLAFFGPACCMVAGAVLLNRMVRPVADIEQQLFQVATSPSVESCELREVPSVGAAALGWNRVVQQRLSWRRRPTRCSSGSGNRSSKAGTAGWTRCSTAFPTAWPRPMPTGRLTYTNLPMAVILGLEGCRRRRCDERARRTSRRA